MTITSSLQPQCISNDTNTKHELTKGHVLLLGKNALATATTKRNQEEKLQVNLIRKILITLNVDGFVRE